MICCTRYKTRNAFPLIIRSNSVEAISLSLTPISSQRVVWLIYIHQHLHTNENDLSGHGNRYAYTHNASSSLLLDLHNSIPILSRALVWIGFHIPVGFGCKQAECCKTRGNFVFSLQRLHSELLIFDSFPFVNI